MSGAPEIIRRAKRVVEAYTEAPELESFRDVLDVLTDVLDDLTEAFGHPLPDFEEAFRA